MGLKAVANVGGGGGGGTVTGTGTPGKIAKFATASSIGDSLLSESGTTITSAATAETFGSAQTWTVGAPNSQALVVLSNAGLERTLVLDTISRAVGVGVPTTPSTLLHVSDGVTTFAGTTGAGVRLDRATEALFSSSDGTRSLRAGLTGGNAVIGTSTATDLLLQRGNVTAATLTSGAIATLTLTAGGAGYTSAAYSQQALTGGTGSGATADFVVAGGIITSCVLRSPGTGYAAADALSCATLGAGAGLVVTVATISQVVAGPGNVTALRRIGAGTATPISTLDSVGLSTFRAAGLYQLQPSSSFGPTSILAFAQAVFDSSAEASGVTVVPASGTQYNTPICIVPRYDTSLRSASTTIYGSFVFPQLEATAPAAGTTAVFGIQSSPTVRSATITGSTLLIRGVLSSPGIVTVGVGNTVSQFTGVQGSLSISATNVVTVTNAYSLLAGGVSMSGAAHVVTNFYGLQLPNFSAGTGTITNRWGISQEDTLAKNYFAGNVGISTASPGGPLSVTPLQYNTGTASQSLFVITGVGTTFTAAMVGSQFVFANGVSAGTITVFTSATSITVSVSQTVTAQAYAIGYTGLQVSTAGNVGIGTTSPTSLLTVNGNLAFNSGYGSAAVAYGCRAWVNFIGATAVIRGSGGVSSLTRAAAGTYTINYTTAMPDINYSAVATKQSVGSNADCQLYDLFASRTTTSSAWVNVEAGAVVDSANINIAFFR